MPDLPTRAEIEESQRICDAATPGPWLVNDNYPYGESNPGTSRYVEGPEKCICHTGKYTHDVEFIAHARTAMPRLNAAYLALLDRLAEKDAEIDRLLGVAADALRDNAEQGAEIERMKMEPPSWLFDCPRCGSRMRLAEMEDES